MKAKAYVVHRLPGRVRLKIRSHRRKRPFFDELERRLRRLDSVTDVRTNPTTGSVLIEHKGEVADLAREVFGSDIGALVEIALSAPPVARRLQSEIESIDEAVRNFSHGEIDLATLASMGLLAMAAVQLLRDRQPAIAVTLSWYAAELLRRSSSAEAHPPSGH